jgi:hypothetical protein
VCVQQRSTGIPCAYIIAVILKCKEDPQIYIRTFVSLDSYHKPYVNSIYPLNMDATSIRMFTDPLSLEDNDSANAMLEAPHDRRAPGRSPKQFKAMWRDTLEEKSRNFRAMMD